MDAGARHAFAPSPEPFEGTIYRIGIVFEAPDGRGWTAGTDMMMPTRNSAEDFCDAPNARLGLDRDARTDFTERIFIALRTQQRRFRYDLFLDPEASPLQIEPAIEAPR